MPPEFQFRSLTEDDFELLHAWLNQPQVREFYQKEPITLAEVDAHYRPRLALGWPTRCFIAMIDHEPFAYLQTYTLAAWPDYAASLHLDHGTSMDFYIGDPAYGGRGLGQAMLRQFLDRVMWVLYPSESLCYLAHAASNHRALAASRAAGFQHLRNLMEDGQTISLLVFELNHPISIDYCKKCAYS